MKNNNIDWFEESIKKNLGIIQKLPKTRCVNCGKLFFKHEAQSVIIDDDGTKEDACPNCYYKIEEKANNI